MLLENKEVCMQCPNHCPITELKCPRGRRALGGQSEEQNSYGEHGMEHGRRPRKHGERYGKNPNFDGNEEGRRGRNRERHGRHMMSPDRESLEGLMSACGHHLHHRGRRGGGQGGILALLAEQESIDQKDLQNLLQIQPGSVSEILTKLEHKGLIIREKNEDDRRRSVIRLTEMGRKALESQTKRINEADMFAVLSEEEQEELKILLKKLLDSWER